MTTSRITSRKGISIIPEPVRIQNKDGFFKIDENVNIYFEDPFRENCLFLKDSFLNDFNLNLNSYQLRGIKPEGKYIKLLYLDIEEFPLEGYMMDITPEYIQIKANNTIGGFYGIQSLKQLLFLDSHFKSNPEELILTVPCGNIEDFPRFNWRGFMLDESRHFFGKEVVKKIIDIMALFKLNKFHWHLTDDQGWRIEIKKYPSLIEIGSKRKGEKLRSIKRKLQTNQINEEYSGYYSQEEILDVIEYAKRYNIEIIPEIDIPGHTTAILAAYPKLSCTGGPFEVTTHYGIIEDVLCAGNEAVYSFLDGILDEIINLFPSKIVHVGGDEVPKTRWENCAKCQAKVQRENLKNVNALQPYFTNRMAKYLLSKEKILMGWNEILNDNLVPEALCQYWTPDLSALIEQVEKGRKVVMSEGTSVYLNYGYKIIDMEKVYQYEPVPDTLNASFHDNILGIEACLWTEFISDQATLTWLAFPRLMAVAESGWTLKKNKNFEDFMGRLLPLMKVIKRYDVNLPSNEEFITENTDT